MTTIVTPPRDPAFDPGASAHARAFIVFLLGAALALSHLANEWIALAQPWGPAWKASGIVVLGFAALLWRAPLTGFALFFSAAGDVLLELDGLFVAGMGAFGLAHVVYASIFGARLRRDGVAATGWLLAAVVLAVSVVLLVWLQPGMGDLAIPAMAYQLVITAMVSLALLSRAPLLAKIGAVVFMISDTLIAVGLFREIAVPAGSVWITYAAAQILLCWSLAQKS